MNYKCAKYIYLIVGAIHELPENQGKEGIFGMSQAPFPTFVPQKKYRRYLLVSIV